ncbi:Ser/Thr protein kinase RdoA (MazF antagonist) [Paenibacillus phyllosphaerae]|uniref:Ser/Thr protein kinase RdoA (MazF antagonist) n=1 Tax=Paenibacillus phyllosphaerae TaxID=274593 RepID=A0A7W5B5F8_9BACL|nr:phosphotransferase [Paenibacillus phyllosphaerae]MBB3114617.1 Ser/Thr protein kinase RdoA (MazF antagonist) [Paenibacillus phyllosphaerae]
MSKERELMQVQAHGMGTTLVEPDWAPIQLREANEILARYAGIGMASALIWHSPRPFSSAAIAETEQGPLFVKRHHAKVRDITGLGEEHRLIGHLRSNGIPVSDILIGLDGESAYMLGEWTYEVHRLAKGTDLYRDAVSWSPFQHKSHAYAAGVALAKLHVAAASYEASARSTRTLVSSFTIFASAAPRDALHAYMEARPALSDFLANKPWMKDFEDTFLPWHKRLAPWISGLQPLWTHNDWHASNLLWHEEGATAQVETILDFGLADRTTAVYDLATAIERNMIDWLSLDEEGGEAHVRYDHVDALLNGYESVRPMTAYEMAALPAILPIVHAEFALAEIDYFAGIVESASNAELAYERYWLGHAKWFERAAGIALLTYLKRRYDKRMTE